MTEPTGTYDPRRFDSLNDALRAMKIPFENHELIRKFTDAIGIAEYYERGDHVLAVRRGQGKPLWIYASGTSGFASVEEVVQTAGDIHRWPSDRGWGITHPSGSRVNNDWHDGRSSSLVRKVCPVCQQLIASTSDDLFVWHGDCKGSRTDSSALPLP